jgi:hypothetical protein
MRLCVRILLFCALCCFVLSQVYAGERVVHRGALEGAGVSMGPGRDPCNVPEMPSVGASFSAGGTPAPFLA